MTDRFEQWQDRFNTLSLRERLLLAVAIIAVVYIGFEALLMTDVYKKQKFFENEMTTWQQRNKDANQHIADITKKLNSIKSGGEGLEEKILVSKVAEVGEKLEDIIVKFIRPKQMVNVLKNLLEKEPGLRLMQFKNIPAKPLFLTIGEEQESIEQLNEKKQQVVKLLKFYRDRDLIGVQADFDKSRSDLEKKQLKENMDKVGIPQVYKHGILIELQGTYKSTLSYLKSLEKLPWKFYWDAVAYEVVKYPKAKVTILINTLSLEREWVSV